MKLRHKLVLDFYFGGLLHVLLKLPTMLLGRLLRRDHQIFPGEDVAFVKFLGGGSLVIAYPSLLAIKQSGRRLKLVTTAGIRPFAELLGVFDEIHTIRDNSMLALVMDSLAVIWKLWRCPILVDLEIHSRLSTIFCLLTCARKRLSFYSVTAFWRRNLATHLLYFNQHAPVYYFYDQVAAVLGADAADFAASRQAFTRVLEALGPADVALSSANQHIGIAPTCSELGGERMLKIEDWVQIVTNRASRPESTCIHLLGAPSEKAALEKLAQALRGAQPTLKVRNHAGEMQLPQAVRLLSKLDCLLSIDSSLLHFARLQNVPTESWWGPTDPVLRLREMRCDEAHYRKLSCSPCVHVSGECPCCGDNRCMRAAVASDQQAIDENPIWLLAPESAGGK